MNTKRRFQILIATRARRIAIVVLVGVAIAAAASAGVWAALQETRPAAREMAAMLPHGALLTIEAKDFAGLLRHWNDSKEKSAWLKSDNYSIFSRSRLFGRLGDAQHEFAVAAGLPPDLSFLNEVAGEESVFAWYDIGKLEFLYVTRMNSGDADKTRLVQMRGKFETRQAGGKTFYVRTQSGQDGNGGDQSGQPRTVAFATSGDWLLLATREDLMAGALTLMAGNAGNSAPGASVAQNSLAVEPWYVDTLAVAAKEPGDLRMTLNLEKIVPSPYFRSYWVQRNITEMKQYRSAVADLYMEADDFREERVLAPKSPPDHAGSGPDLAALAALTPEHAGVFRAVAAPSLEAAVASVDERLIGRAAGAYADARFAPDAGVSVREAGSPSDFETRLDAAPVAHPVKGAELAVLRQTVESYGLEAMMTVGRTGHGAGQAADGIWVPFESAVVLSAAKDWDAAAMQAALREAMQARLTAGGLGLAWKTVKVQGGSYFEISDTKPLELAVRGKVCILADDPGLMEEMVARLSDAGGSGSSSGGGQTQATMIAGVDFSQERGSLARWSALVDGTNSGLQSRADADANASFFSQNIRSLGDVFAQLESERVVEWRGDGVTRQTVTYTWRR